MDKNFVAITEYFSQLLNGNNKLIFKNFLDVSDAAIFLGVSKETMYKLNFRKEIPFYRPKNGKKIYYKREDLINYIQGVRISSTSELDQKSNEILKNLENV